MARITFTAMVAEVVGKLAGSVFQYSYGGYQVRTRVSPRNPQTQYQQLRRGDFGFLSASWRSLSIPERQSFIDNVSPGQSAINLFTSTNVNLTLINEPTIVTYVPSAALPDFELNVTDANPEELIVVATGATTTVPAGTKLLIYSTYLKQQTKIFTNPSQFSPIISIDEGTDMTTPVNIIAAFNTLYGQLTPDMYMCIKCVLIKKSNGIRSNEFINCINTTEMASKYTRLQAFTNNVDNGGSSSAILYTYAMPANKLANVGDEILIDIFAEFTFNAGGNFLEVLFDGSSPGGLGSATAGIIKMQARIIRTGADTINMIICQIKSAAVDGTLGGQFAGIDFTNPITINITGGAPTGTTVFAYNASIDLVQV